MEYDADFAATLDGMWDMTWNARVEFAKRNRQRREAVQAAFRRYVRINKKV